MPKVETLEDLVARLDQLSKAGRDIAVGSHWPRLSKSITALSAGLETACECEDDEACYACVILAQVDRGDV